MKIHACARSNLQAAREFSSKMFVGVLRQRKGNGDYIRNYVKYKEILAYTFSYNDFIRAISFALPQAVEIIETQSESIATYTREAAIKCGESEK